MKTTKVDPKIINDNGEKPNPAGIKPIKIETIDANKA